MQLWIRRALGGTLALALCACGDARPGPASVTAPPPVSPEIAKLYRQTCRACHATPGTGAPPSFDRAAWAPRLEQGMDTLLLHTIGGYKGMPPMGSCMDCGEEEFIALIRYMAGQAPETS